MNQQNPARRMRHGERPTEPLQWEGESVTAATSGDVPTDLLDEALCAAQAWANAEYVHARNLGKGGPGINEQCDRAEAAARAAIKALAARIERAAAPTDADLRLLLALAYRIENSNESPIPVSVDAARVIRSLCQRAAAPVSGGELEAAIKEVNSAFVAYANGETRNTDDFNAAVDKIRAAVAAAKVPRTEHDNKDVEWQMQCAEEAQGAPAVASKIRAAAKAAAKVPTRELPPLPEADEFSATRMLQNGQPSPRYTAASMRAYGELCRAAAPVEQGQGAGEGESK